MKTFEFPARVTADGAIELPDELRRILTTDAVVRVLVLVGGTDEIGDDTDWSRLGAEQILSHYGDADDIYDRVS